MQTHLRRGAALAVPFLLLLFFIGCGPNKEAKYLATIDSLTYKVETLNKRVIFLDSQLYVRAPSGKHKKVKMANKPGRHHVQVCVKPDLSDPDIDSVLVTVNMIKGSSQTQVGELKFSRTWPVAQASIRWNETAAFDIVLITTWYKHDGSTHLGTWCDTSTCTIPDTAKCSDLFTNASTARSNSSGSSTTTVSVDEQ